LVFAGWTASLTLCERDRSVSPKISEHLGFTDEGVNMRRRMIVRIGDEKDAVKPNGTHHQLL
jgi:hypothetical protein